MTIKNNFHRYKRISFLILLFTLPVLVSCSKSQKNDPDDAPEAMAADSTSTIGVSLSSKVQKLEGIRAIRIPKKKIYRQVKAMGVVLSPHDLTTMRTKYQQEKALLKKLKAQLFVSQKEYNRISKLYKSQQASQKTFEAERAQWIADQSDYNDAKLSLNAMADSVQQEWGTVIANWVRKGSPKLNRVINQESWIVLVTPSENQAGNFKLKREIALGISKNRLYSARFISRSPKLDQRMQTHGYFYLTRNKSDNLAPDMNVIAWVPTGKSSEGVAIPDSAVVWSQGMPWVYVQTDPGNFVRKSISTAKSFGSKWYDQKNITVSDRVVVSGAQFLLSQEMLSKMPVQHGDGDGD